MSPHKRNRMSSLRTVSMSVYSVAVDHEARAPQASKPPAVARRKSQPRRPRSCRSQAPPAGQHQLAVQRVLRNRVFVLGHQRLRLGRRCQEWADNQERKQRPPSEFSRCAHASASQRMMEGAPTNQDDGNLPANAAGAVKERVDCEFRNSGGRCPSHFLASARRHEPSGWA
jgi:hypothetical protein